MSLPTGESLGVQVIRGGQLVTNRPPGPTVRSYGGAAVISSAAASVTKNNLVVPAIPAVPRVQASPGSQEPVMILREQRPQGPMVQAIPSGALGRILGSNPHTAQPMVMKGKWNYELWRPLIPGRPETLRPILLGETPNLIVKVGKVHILTTQFGSGAPIIQANWFAGLMNHAGFTGLSDAHTMGSHSTWTEYTVYGEATRQPWNPGAPVASTSVTITNSSPITFSMTASGDVEGLFIVGDVTAGNASTKGGVTGTLWAETAFVGGFVHVEASDQLRCTYTVTM